MVIGDWREKATCCGNRRRCTGAVIFAVAVVPLAAACDSTTGRAGPPGEAPETVSLTVQTVISGFAGGVLREDVAVGDFRITKFPITRANYGACVTAGACEATEGEACSAEARARLGTLHLEDPKSPESCVSVDQATAYCRWIGGRLPRLSEWLLAARGPAPQRYPWGEQGPSCEQHARAHEERLGVLLPRPVEPCASAGGPNLVVGKHAAGAAASGMQDVLLTPGELVASQADAQFAACDEGTAGCFVFGTAPGAVDSPFPIQKPSEPAFEAEKLPEVYGFRCVLEES